MNVVVLIADAIMILLLFRNQTSYFRPYRQYFIAIYGIFLNFPARELLMMAFPDENVLRLTTQFMMVGAGVCIALLWGHLATRLYLHPGQFSLRRVIAAPSRPIHLLFLLYMVPFVTVVFMAFLLPGAVQDTPTISFYPLSWVSSNNPNISDALLGVGVIVIIDFVGYPFMVLTSLRSQLKDKEVRSALRRIALSFGSISALIFVNAASETRGLNLAAASFLVSVALLAIVDHEFSRPSFLKSFLGLVPKLESRSSGKRTDMRVLLYRRNEDKYRPIARFASEGVNQNSLVAYFYHGDDTAVREGLGRQGFATREAITKRNLRLVPFSSLYEDEDLLDEEAALTYLGEMIEEAKTLGKNGLRIVVDYKDVSKRPVSKFVNHLADLRWTGQDHYVWVLMMFSEEAFQGQEAGLALLKSRIDTISLSDAVDTFSRTVGLDHSEVAGKKIILEYDPASEYERILRSLISESYSNFERSVVFTRRDSPVCSALGFETGAKMFLLTPRVSYPRVEEENRVLLPAYDSSLMLDALNKTIQAFAGASFTIIFDSISHFIFTLGPDRALSLVRQAMELMISSKVTAVFLMNGGAHEQKTVSIFENLFDMEIACEAGARIPRIKKAVGLEAIR